MLRPTQRFKQRYVAFSLIIGSVRPTYPEAKELVHAHFLSFFGESGIASLAFKFVKYDDRTGRGIVRCERSRVDEAIFCMACVSSWKGEEARMEPCSTSGTIKRL